MDDSSHDDILRLLNSMPLSRPTVPQRMSRSGLLQGDERRCSNCQSHEACWGGPPMVVLPTGFSFRPGWTSLRYLDHMKGIVGQLCDSFIGNTEELRRHFRDADRKNRERLGIVNEWDENSN